ncbi:hypothetical protein I312_100007 [Cryptococcus bacillisporus CA1280]|uniref:uncharacterized protein n=1 Tax=Cryptococcus bacillisporus CA1280 TaxID=1296109 RepID=UPI003365C790
METQLIQLASTSIWMNAKYGTCWFLFSLFLFTLLDLDYVKRCFAYVSKSFLLTCVNDMEGVSLPTGSNSVKGSKFGVTQDLLLCNTRSYKAAWFHCLGWQISHSNPSTLALKTS